MSPSKRTRGVTYDHRADLGDLEMVLGYRFDDVGLLERALTHRSYLNEVAESTVRHNQRLEFLGDAVLGMVVASRLFEEFEEFQEGALSSSKSRVVCESSLARAAKGLDLGAYVRLGKGEIVSGARMRSSILADCFEAVLAAVFLDGGLEPAVKVVADLFADSIMASEPNLPREDYKSRLQSMLQGAGLERPVYSLDEEWGPAHQRQFRYLASSTDIEIGRGTGHSKKESQQAAAKEALQFIDSHGIETLKSNGEHKD
jgi:ribonuclease III